MRPMPYTLNCIPALVPMPVLFSHVVLAAVVVFCLSLFPDASDAWRQGPSEDRVGKTQASVEPAAVVSGSPRSERASEAVALLGAVDQRDIGRVVP